MTSPDRIEIHELRVRTVVGVHAEEREAPREVILHLTLVPAVRGAEHTDVLEDALDYEAVSRRIEEHAAGRRFRLIEALAESLATVVLEEFPVESLEMRLEKPGAIPAARSVAVVITRTRGGEQEAS